ncbi:hypothetical protein MBRA_02373 [Methylobacterium brachiatum]|nr:hypothetical protein MBRA_02373 [Methylobacterium brachiatum]
MPFVAWAGRRMGGRHALDLRAWAALGLALVITGSAALFIVHLETRAVEDNERSLGGLATILADQADRALQAIELVQDAVLAEFRTAGIRSADQYAEVASRPAMHAALRTWIAALPQANAITLVDARGQLLNFSRYWPIPTVNIADRDYFKALSSEPSLQRYVGRPVSNRGDGAMTIYIARKVAAPDGTFLGLVLGAVELGYFEGLYDRISPADDAVVSLFRNDGMLLVRHPHFPGTIGRIFSQAGATLISASPALGGVTRTVSPIDGQDRLVAARALKTYPLILSVSRTAAACLAAARQQAAIVGAATLLLDLGLLGLVLLGRRRAARRRSSPGPRRPGRRPRRASAASGLCAFRMPGSASPSTTWSRACACSTGTPPSSS